MMNAEGADQMRIKEVADRLNVSARAIRFYEEKGLIQLQKTEGNQYRVFSEADVERLKTILALREVGMPLATVKKALDEAERGEAEELIEYLERQRAEMTDEWICLKDMIGTTERMIQSLKETQAEPDRIHELAIELKDVKERRQNWEDRWNFDGQADSYDEQVYRSVRDFNVHENYDEALNLTAEWVDAGDGEEGLDIGIGTGNLAGRFVKSGAHMYGVDQSANMLKGCARKFPQIETKLGHFLALPFDDHRFDFVVTSYALHHLEDEQKELALAEMERVLKPAGRICITDLMFENAYDRKQYLLHWIEEDRKDIIEAVEDEFFADRSRLLRCLDNLGFQTRTRRINDILHIVFAEKIF